MAYKKLKSWLRGLLGGIIGSACTAGLSVGGNTLANLVGADVKPLDLKQLGSFITSGAIVGALLYLKQSPIPQEEEDTSMIEKADTDK